MRKLIALLFCLLTFNVALHAQETKKACCKSKEGKTCTKAEKKACDKKAESSSVEGVGTSDNAASTTEPKKACCKSKTSCTKKVEETK
jgi:hypothetical protein